MTDAIVAVLMAIGIYCFAMAIKFYRLKKQIYRIYKYLSALLNINHNLINSISNEIINKEEIGYKIKKIILSDLLNIIETNNKTYEKIRDILHNHIDLNMNSYNPELSQDWKEIPLPLYYSYDIEKLKTFPIHVEKE